MRLNRRASHPSSKHKDKLKWPTIPTTQGLPTIADAGVAGFDFLIWYGIWVPAGTSAAVVDKLSQDIARVIAGRDMQSTGASQMGMTQLEFARASCGARVKAQRVIKPS